MKCGRALSVALKLARAGWCGGDPERILGTRVDIVMAAVHYEHFRAEYERTFIEINKERS